ncbi:MAG: CCA tRNA nucleotidyltransferase [bacterium]
MRIRMAMSRNRLIVTVEDHTFNYYTKLVYSIARDQGIELVIVGGAPREIMLGRKPKDIDFLVLKGNPQTVPLMLHTNHDFFYPVLFEKFGTYRTGIKGTHELEMEFIPIRADTVEKDLLLRDFTINTMIMIPAGEHQYEINDILGKALNALREKVLQTPVEPEITIKDDPLRIMRAVRFFCTIGMQLDPALKSASKALAHLLKDVAVERIRDELFIILLSNTPSRGMLLMKDLGILDIIMPEVLPMIGFDQRSPYHKDELFTHSLRVMDNTPAWIETRLSALFHDTGKPFSTQQTGEKVTYYGHQDKSAELFRTFSSRLKIPNHISDTVEALIKRHMINYTPDWKDSTIRKFIKHNHNILDYLLALYRADASSLADPSKALSMVDELTNRINQQHVEQISRLKSPLNGNEIQKLLNIPPGPKIGEIKKAIVDAILEGTIEPTKSAAEAFIKQAYNHQ